MISKASYIAQLPGDVQEEIRQRVAVKLDEDNVLTEKNLQIAMEGRLCDLEELLDICEYVDSKQGLVMTL